MNNKIETVIENLRKNNIDAYYACISEDVVPIIAGIMKQGETCAVGGSSTLFECGVIDHLRSGRYTFFDRYAEGLSEEEIHEVHRDAFNADTYLSGCNAITQNGELYNVDGNGNRVAAIAYGPKSVIIVAGVNKIVKDIDSAVLRVKEKAAPEVVKKRAFQTYCGVSGYCQSLDSGDAGSIADGCLFSQRVCCSYLLSGFQRIKGRIKVILVDEVLGM